MALYSRRKKDAEVSYVCECNGISCTLHCVQMRSYYAGDSQRMYGE